MSEMVERVARALYDQRQYEMVVLESPFERSPYQEHYLRFARAAIEAMREPTAPMIESGCEHCKYIDEDMPHSAPRLAARDSYQAMIDQALKADTGPATA